MFILCISYDFSKSTKLLGPEVIQLFSCSTQLSMKFIMLIDVKCQQLMAF